VRMSLTRSIVVLGSIWFIAACGGGQEAKQPPDCRMLSTGCGDAGAAMGDAGAAEVPTSGGGEVDAGAGSSTPAAVDAGVKTAAADAGAGDDVDKSVSVCGDEAGPIEKRVRPKIKACFFEAKAKNPALDGHVRITFVIDDKGKIKKTEIAQAKQLGAAATACMMKALKESKLDAARCPSKTVGFEQVFGHAARD
jgi:hypothetical protein